MHWRNVEMLVIKIDKQYCIIEDLLGSSFFKINFERMKRHGNFYSWEMEKKLKN